MNKGLCIKAHWSFWVIISIILVWGAINSINFLMQLEFEIAISYREYGNIINLGRPLWVTIGAAASIFGSVIGCFLLLLKSTSAFYVFLVSLVGTILAVSHSLTSIDEIFGMKGIPVLISYFLIVYAQYSEHKGWLKTHNR